MSAMTGSASAGRVADGRVEAPEESGSTWEEPDSARAAQFSEAYAVHAVATAASSAGRKHCHPIPHIVHSLVATGGGHSLGKLSIIRIIENDLVNASQNDWIDGLDERRRQAVILRTSNGPRFAGKVAEHGGRRCAVPARGEDLCFQKFADTLCGAGRLYRIDCCARGRQACSQCAHQDGGDVAPMPSP